MVISHALAFANVVEINDRNTITILCHNVLRDCISFEEECSIVAIADTQKRRLKVELLETSLIKLESVINECLLRLVLIVFVDISLNPIQKLRDFKEENIDLNQTEIDDKTADFDLTLDRLMQIGLFAVIFSGDTKVKSILRSCLASLESLDMNLVPSIFSNCGAHTDILENHWKSEVKMLQYYVQEIIDTNAFCSSFIEILTNSIDRIVLEYDKAVVEEILKKTEVLHQHFLVNFDNLKLGNDSTGKIYFDDFKLIVNECKASLQCSEEIHPDRIVKRLKILKSIVKKLQKSFEGSVKGGSSNVFDSLPDSLKTFSTNYEHKIDDSLKFFETFGITPSSRASSFFYHTKTDVTPSDSMIGRTSLLLSSNIKTNTSQSLRAKAKRISLRVNMFKRQKDMETLELWNSFESASYSSELHITDILDQLTNLSTTLSGPTEMIASNPIERDSGKTYLILVDRKLFADAM